MIETRPGAERLQTAEATEPRRQCIIIPGIFTTNAGMKDPRFGIGTAFARKYGSENVDFFNSAISADTPDPKRFEAIENRIRTRVEKGPVDVVVHSYGAAELWKVLKSMREKDPEFFNNPKNKENLRFVLIGPSGFNEGFVSKVHYAVNVPRLNGPTGKGLHALSTWTPNGVSHKDLSKVLKRYSNKNKRIPTERFDGVDNEVFLTVDERGVREHYYGDLREAVAKRKNRRHARKIVKEIGEALNDPLERVFNVTTDIGPKKKESIKWDGFAGVRLFARAAGKKPMEEFAQLADGGFCVDVFLPEYDFVVPLWKVRKFFKGRKKEIPDHVLLGEGLAHASLGLQPDHHAELIFNSRRTE